MHLLIIYMINPVIIALFHCDTEKFKRKSIHPKIWRSAFYQKMFEMLLKIKTQNNEQIAELFPGTFILLMFSCT